MNNLFPFLALNKIALQLGPLAIHWYAIFIVGGAALAVWLACKEAPKRNIKTDDIIDFVLFAFPLGIVGARLYYVIFQWQYYQNDLSEIYRIWDGGIAIYGGLLGALLVLVIFCRKKQLSAWLFLDIISPTVILAQGIGRWGNFINQEAHGEVVSHAFLTSLHLPGFIIEQMNISGVYYQPTFLYESVWDILGFVILMLLRHRKHLFKRGEIFLTYVAWYSFGRFFIEGMRTDSLMLGALRVSQWLSVILFIGAIILLAYRRYYRPNEPWYLAGNVEYEGELK